MQSVYSKIKLESISWNSLIKPPNYCFIHFEGTESFLMLYTLILSKPMCGLNTSKRYKLASGIYIYNFSWYQKAHFLFSIISDI